MNTETNHKEDHGTEKKQGFLASLFERIDQAMKKAAEKKSSGCCSCSGRDHGGDSGKGGKCC